MEKISSGAYYVENNCTYKKGNIKICDFHIADLTVYERCNKPISFELTLESEEEEKTVLFPIFYLYDPIGWFYDGFFEDGFHINTTRKNFEESMVKIVTLILDNNKYDTLDDCMGWKLENLTGRELYTSTFHSFGKFENPGSSISQEEYQAKPQNYLFEYLNLTDIAVSAPLLSYMLLSLLTSLEIFGTNTRTNFQVAITGGSVELRRKFALFFANVYKRDSTFTSTEYKFFHVNPKDTTTDIRLKAKVTRDCVLIAFEPDKRHLRTLLQEIYQTNVIDEDHPIENLLLITGEKVETTATHNTLVIELNNNHTTKEIEHYFKVNEPIPLEDNLIECIYYFLKQLTTKLLNNRHYVRDKFIKHKNKFLKHMVTPDFSEVAQEVAQPLLFALELYTKHFETENAEQPDKIKHLLAVNKAKEAIIATVKNSFPAKGYATDKDFEIAKTTCIQIDSYFTLQKKTHKNAKLIGEIGCEECVTEKRIWYDNENFYITLKHINEFLKLTGWKMVFNLKVKGALAEKEIIKIYTKKDGKPEYSTHLQKPLYGKTKTQDRFITFNRKRCKEYQIFQNIEAIMINRCQIDVKPEKNKETGEN